MSLQTLKGKGGRITYRRNLIRGLGPVLGLGLALGLALGLRVRVRVRVKVKVRDRADISVEGKNHRFVL